jgi:protein-tyrosine-phosphatase
MSVLGYDLTAHKSRIVRDSMLKTAAVILGMTRQQLIELSLREPDGWTRAFTFAELVRLAEAKGPRSPGEPLDLWISRVGRDRVRSGALNLPLAEDIPDPIGKPFRAYARTRDQLLELATRLADLLQPV